MWVVCMPNLEKNYPMILWAISIQANVDLFDELLTRVELPENYVVSCFVRGLKPEIGLLVKMLEPKTLAKAISLAKIQEQTLVVQKQFFGGVLPNPRNILKFSNATPSYSQNHSHNIRLTQATPKHPPTLLLDLNHLMEMPNYSLLLRWMRGEGFML